MYLKSNKHIPCVENTVTCFLECITVSLHLVQSIPLPQLFSSGTHSNLFSQRSRRCVSSGGAASNTSRGHEIAGRLCRLGVWADARASGPRAVLQDARVTAWECGTFDPLSASLLLWVHKESMHWSRSDIECKALYWTNACCTGLMRRGDNGHTVVWVMHVRKKIGPKESVCQTRWVRNI